MHVKWAALAQTAGLSFLITVGVVVVFALGVRALDRREAGGSPTAALAGAAACFTTCAAAVVYGLSLLAS